MKPNKKFAEGKLLSDIKMKNFKMMSNMKTLTVIHSLILMINRLWMSTKNIEMMD
jgi:hypothetical protein